MVNLQIVRRFMLSISLVIAGLLVLTACQSNNPNKEIKSNDIAMIQVKCIQLCEDWEDKPFDERQFDEKSDITIFVNAIKRAKPMDGSLDYGAEFELNLFNNDQSTQGYHLSLGKNNGNTGLLVALSNTEQGYAINVEDADQLRDLIWE